LATELPEPSLGLWWKRVVAEFGPREALRRQSSSVGGSVTYSQLDQLVRQAAAGFAAMGVHPGDRIGLIFDNRREWIVCDLALAGQGAIDVPRGADTSNVEIAMILAHSGARGAVVDSAARATALAAECEQFPALEFIVIVDGNAKKHEAHPVREAHRTRPPLRVVGFEELISRGADRIAHGIDDFEMRAPKVQPDDLLTLVYTSGTTGKPKGVQLSHRNVLSNCYHIRGPIPVSPGDVALSILPTWHMFERIVEYAVFDRGGVLVYTDARRIRADIASERPRLMATVPRIWETLRGAMDDAVAKLPPIQQAVFRRASALSIAHLRARVAGRKLAQWFYALPAALARKYVFLPKLQKSGIASLKVCVSGGGALPVALDEFFLSIGVPILNGYGLTETSPVICVRRLERNRPGPVGPPLGDTELKLFDVDGRPAAPGAVGVLRVRGPQVTRGYYKDEEQTQRAFPEDHWFDTGDLARIDDRGDVWIVGRAKDTIALRGGEKVEPERVETALRQSPLIVQSVIVGQDAKVLGAIIVPNLEKFGDAVTKETREGTSEWITDENVRKAIRTEIDRCVSAAEGFRPYERPVKFILLRKPIDPHSGLMTQTLKIKRQAVADRFAKQIAELLQD
jgi:long-chain acyl-CoA synthetase